MPRMHELSMGLLIIGAVLPDGLRSVDTAVVQREGEVIEKDGGGGLLWKLPVLDTLSNPAKIGLHHKVRGTLSGRCRIRAEVKCVLKTTTCPDVNELHWHGLFT